MFDTIIVVTDRTVLDDQLRNTIRSLEKTDGVVSGVDQGSSQLKEFLESGKDIIVTPFRNFLLSQKPLLRWVTEPLV